MFNEEIAGYDIHTTLSAMIMERPLDTDENLI
jgi:hypothetical protein